jgi:hypothetical protein
VIRRGLECGRVQRLVEQARHRVVGAESALFAHDLDLALQLVGQQRQVAHAIGVELEHGLERLLAAPS